MKSIFLLGILLLVPIGLAIAFLYMAGHAVYSLLSDWRLRREVQTLRSESGARREQRRANDEARLANGCQHVFGEGLGVFPPSACPKCGMERARPPGPCDHVWQKISGPMASSKCSKCGKVFLGMMSNSSS